MINLGLLGLAAAAEQDSENDDPYQQRPQSLRVSFV
jgi:hypothetical protein